MKKYIFFIIIIFFTSKSYSSHFVGGEITWECISDPTNVDFGKYIFQLKVYRDCTGIDFSSASAGGSETLTVHDNALIPNIACFWDNTVDISATGVSGGAQGSLQFCYDCSNYATAPAGSQTGKVIHQITYRSLPTDLGGNGSIPPVTGWHFTWGSAARNAADNMTSAGSWLLRAIMYPYTKNTTIVPYVYEDAFPCFDSSPIFKEEAKTVLCLDVPFSYSHLAFDPDFDSLSYNWAYPLQGSSFSYNTATPLSDTMSYQTAVYPFSVNNQLPSTPAGPLNLNNNTGEISFIATGLQGVFLTCVKVTTVKCFQVISEVFREVQVVLTDCAGFSSNTPPTFSAPVGTQTWYSYINSAGLPSYYTTVMAGELVEFDVTANDIDMQNLSLEIEGAQIDLALALSNPANFNILSSNPGDITGRFSWQSNCDHLREDSCAGFPNQEFNFNLKAYDDFCPANGTTIANLTINLIPPTPDFRCTEVDSLGNVDLHWYYPTSLINADISYDIYHSKNLNNSYTKIGSVVFPDSTYSHQGSDAHLSSSYYYIVAKGVCINSLTNDVDSISDTLRTIFLDAKAINSVPIVASLDWNHMRENFDIATQALYQYNVFSTDTLYSLFYSYDDISGFNIFSQYSDTLTQKRSDFCSYDPEFYIQISDSRGCKSSSNIVSVHLGDDEDPDNPLITDVSVNSNGQSVISWQPTLGAEKHAIYLYSSIDGWLSIDTVENIFSYTYLNSNAIEQSELFSIRALDSCDNESLASYDFNGEHNSIFLEMDLAECSYSAQLNWNEYINWENGTSHYLVIVKETDLAGNVYNNEYRVVDNNFNLLNITDSHEYIINVNAYNFDSTYFAVSNVITFVPNLPKKPNFNYIDYVSINHVNGSVDLSCLIDNQAVISRYDIMRSITGENNYTNIAQIPFIANAASILYNDLEAATSANSYQYLVYPIDTCGERIYVPSYNSISFANDTSYAQTILVETNINIDYTNGIGDIPYTNGESVNDQYTNTITFNEYDKWLGEVASYRLFRSLDGGYTFSPIPLYEWDRISNPYEPLAYIDVVTKFGKDNGRMCYYVQALEGYNNPYGSSTVGSLSNVSCIAQTPLTFIPTVFTPNGDEHNEIFQPVSFFVDELGYSFSIYSRQGSLLFTTNSPSKGWDGTYKGNIVPNGEYVYHLQYINGVGEYTEQINTITLIR
tara:strand:+ start:41500 stop:45054 length:3555 start_codon:yes stop_codon:yes gene_type:complete